jgi:uncharacterized protein YcbK (DUF882 family)
MLLSAKIANPAVAGGETRTINFYNPHTQESGAFTYLVNGSYDPDVLDKLNWFLRDWHINETTKMDPKLFDIIWQVYQESGSQLPIEVLSAYRSPQTNAMLRMRSRQVAEHSQHMEGKAIDAHFQDVSVAKARDIAMHMQAGGVGFYPVGGTPWVHIDSGSIRYWPRMSRDALSRIFPDGKTVFIPADGQPMSGFEEARAEIESRGGAFQTANSGFNLFTWLFSNHSGGADDEEESGPDSVVTNSKGAVVGRGRRPATATTQETVAVDQTPSTPAATVVASLDPTAKTDETVDAAPAAPPAPLPPRRPADLALAYADAQAPIPPSRPSDIDAVVASNDDASSQDLIRALLAKGGLPQAITRGIVMPPKRALALAETPSMAAIDMTPDSTAKLAKAAALVAPMPKARPPGIDKSWTASIIARPAKTSIAMIPALPGPEESAYGGLPIDGFGPGSDAAENTPLGAALKNAAH